MTVEIVEFFHNMQNTFLDYFFNFISFIGEDYVYITLIVILYYGMDKKLGERVAFTLITASAFNTILKETFRTPRPFEKYPDRITNLRAHTTSGYSFPSGHTQVFASVLFIIGYHIKKHWVYVAFLTLVILMAISRMYLGVHFFEDVVISLILGILYAYLVHWIYKKFDQDSGQMFKIYLLVSIPLLTGLFAIQTKTYITTLGMYGGFVLAMWYEHRFVQFTVTKNIAHKIIRIVLGLIIMLSIQVGFKEIYASVFKNDSIILMFDFIRYFLLVFVGLGLYPQAFRKFNF